MAIIQGRDYSLYIIHIKYIARKIYVHFMVMMLIIINLFIDLFLLKKSRIQFKAT